MLTLAQASSYFDRTQAYDAYSGAPAFLCQVDPYDDSKRDAMVAYRRVLSVAPGVQIPAGRAVTIFDIVWLVAGEPEVDGLEQAHRVKYVMQMADGLLNMGTVTDFLAGTPARAVYGFPGWVKDAREEGESSSIAGMYELLVPLGTPAAPLQVFWQAGAAYLSLSARRLPSDFVGLTCLKLDQVAPVNATLQHRVFNAVAGTHTLGAAVSRPALRVRWQNLFRYDAQMDQRFQEGDFTLAFPLGTAIDHSTRVTFEGVQHRVLAVNEHPGVVAAHLRRG